MAGSTLVIRPQPDADQDVALLARYGVPAVASPVMRGGEVPFHLPEASLFDGVIFTSRHAVDAMTRDPAVTAWTGKTAFVVGAATAAAARQVGFAKLVQGSGGGVGLVPLIRKAFGGSTPPLFWPSAEDIGFDMTVALGKPGFAVTRCPVYRMTPVTRLTASARDRLDAGRIGAVIAMSARSIGLLRRRMADDCPQAPLSGISLIAGSDGIARAAGDGWREILVARTPRRHRLLAIAVLRHRRDRRE